MLLLLGLLLQSSAVATLHAARSPAFAPDGRLALSVDGDLYSQVGDDRRWVRITSGPAWDRDPVWDGDGQALIFSSDRGGHFDLWRVTVAADGRAGEPARVTGTPEGESAPSVGRHGLLAFVRGHGAGARIWMRTSDGRERRLTRGEHPEESPSIAPDGSRIAYVQVTEEARRLLVRALGNDGDSTAASDSTDARRDSLVNDVLGAESVAWAPAGDRLVFSASAGRGGVYVAPLDGHYANLLTASRGDVAWAPDGRSIVVAEHRREMTDYNGDPDRLGERVAGEALSSIERLLTLAAPSPPDAGVVEQPLSVARTREGRNGDAFDRMWERSTRLYFSAADASARRVEWQAVRSRLRPQALAASSDDALARVLYAAIRARPPLRAEAIGRAAVSSAHPVATAAGLSILRAGGNVVDASVAVSFALGVVEPDASGVGGYGQMVVRLAAMRQPTLIEFMSRVPEDASLANASLLVDGHYPADGPVLANVPGTVAGMYTAWKRYGSGKLPWAELLAPAIRAARDGYVVSDGLATTLATEREHFARYDGSRALFFRNGQPLHAGDTLHNPDLAAVLEQIAKRGADGFYGGDVARRLAEDLHGKGNAMRLSDLRRYFAVERAPVSGTYRGYTLYSSAPPASGGVSLVAELNLLEQLATPRLYTDDAPTLHAALSAWLLTPSTRGRIADPGLWPVTVDPFVSKDTARVRWRCFDATRALSAADFRGDSLACGRKESRRAGAEHPAAPSVEVGAREVDAPSCASREQAAEMRVCHAAGTTAFTVADADGNVVAVTQTLGTWGGNFYVTPGLGFLYNDKLTSYPTDPAEFGARLPLARHGSTLAPTIVFRGERPVLAIGAAGNSWITSAVYETLLGVLDDGLSPQQALELPRFLPGDPPGRRARRADRGGGWPIEIEDGFSPDVMRRMRELGYDLRPISMLGELRMGYAAAIALESKRVVAGADPRRAGAAGAIP